MMISIEEDEARFSGRAGAIIYNEDKTKILLENQGRFYRFPGVRIDVHEDSQKAIKRELKEELNISAELKLKYIVELFLNSLKIKYHEIGFYFITQINEETILNNSKSLDGDSEFEWVLISDLENYNIIAKPIKEKVISKKILTDDLEHIIYREY